MNQIQNVLVLSVLVDIIWIQIAIACNVQVYVSLVMQVAIMLVYLVLVDHI